MKISRATVCVQVRGNFLECFEFYTKKMGFIPCGDGSGVYETFKTCEDSEPFFAIYKAEEAAKKIAKYVLPDNTKPSDTLTAVFHTLDFESEHNRLLEAGVEFIDKTVYSGDGWSFNMAYFRDTEGNLLSIEDGGV